MEFYPSICLRYMLFSPYLRTFSLCTCHFPNYLSVFNTCHFLPTPYEVPSNHLSLYRYVRVFLFLPNEDTSKTVNWFKRNLTLTFPTFCKYSWKHCIKALILTTSGIKFQSLNSCYYGNQFSSQTFDCCTCLPEKLITCRTTVSTCRTDYLQNLLPVPLMQVAGYLNQRHLHKMYTINV